MAVEDWIDYGDVPAEYRDSEEREQEWKDGLHTDEKGNMFTLGEMSDSHLLNTIKLFSKLDTKPLIKEAKKRNIWKLTKNMK
jgi:hypothetical protein